MVPIYFFSRHSPKSFLMLQLNCAKTIFCTKRTYSLQKRCLSQVATLHLKPEQQSGIRQSQSSFVTEIQFFEWRMTSKAKPKSQGLKAVQG